MMFSFWNRKSNKSTGQPQQSPDVELSHTPSRIIHVPNVPAQEDRPAEKIPAEVAPEPVVAAVPNHHDAAVSEVHAKLLQAEQLSSTAHPLRPTDPLTDATSPQNPSPEPFFDPATGEQRGFFEPVATISSGDSEQLCDEVWAHLARIRQIQSEIAMMHRQMEGIGDGGGTIDVEVDNDVDVDTVPTQEEEDAAKRAREFDRLPSRFNGRSDNISAMMAKLDDLSKAVTSFHALQPPPLNFDSGPTSRQITHSDTSVPPGSRATPAGTVRTRAASPTTTSPKAILDEKLLHESPINTHPFSEHI